MNGGARYRSKSNGLLQWIDALFNELGQGRHGVCRRRRYTRVWDDELAPPKGAEDPLGCGASVGALRRNRPPIRGLEQE